MANNDPDGSASAAVQVGLWDVTGYSLDAIYGQGSFFQFVQPEVPNVHFRALQYDVVGTPYSQHPEPGIEFVQIVSSSGNPIMVDDTLVGSFNVLAGRTYLVRLSLSTSVINGVYGGTYLGSGDFSNTGTFQLTDTQGAIVDSLSGQFLDSQAVPEPGSFALLGIGLGLLAIRRRPTSGR